MSERIIFVDKDDSLIGVGTREEAWEKGMYLRIVRVILRDENGRILSQYRSPEKKSYPNTWTDSASGHVDEGDTYDTAVMRELQEELGVAVDLKPIGKFTSEDIVDNKNINEINAIYEGRVNSSLEFNLQKSEVSKIKWYELEELVQEMKDTPHSFTPGFRELIARYY